MSKNVGTKTNLLVRNTGFLYIRMIFVMLVSLYTSRVVLHTLGFEDFGIYNVVGSVVVFMSFLQAALRNATFRYITYDLGICDIKKLRTTYSMAIVCHTILALILFVGIGIIGLWFVKSQLNISADRINAACWTFLFSLITFCLSIIRTPFESNILAHERMDFYALTSIVEVILKLSIVFLLVISPIDKLISYSFLLTAVTVILLIWNAVYCRKKFQDCSYVRCWDVSTIRQFASYSGWSLLVNTATITRTQCINIFFNLFLGIIINAAMGIANQVVSVLNTFVTNFTQAFKPQMIKSWAEKDYDYFMKILFSSSKVSYFLLLVVSVPVVANIDFFLQVWLGKYPVMTPIYIKAIILYYLIDALQEPMVTSVHATGNLKFHQTMIATIVFLVIPTSYFMLKHGYSGTSVLIMNACANLVCAIGRTLYMRRLISLDLRKYLTKVILPIAAVTALSLPLPLIITKYYPTCWLNVIWESVLFVLVSLIAFWLIGMNKGEKKIVKAIPAIAKIGNIIRIFK